MYTYFKKNGFNSFERIVNKLKNYYLIRTQNIGVNNLCPRCLKNESISPHHIIPRVNGGGDNKENIIWLCRKCHDEIEILTDEWINNKGFIDPIYLRRLIVNLGL